MPRPVSIYRDPPPPTLGLWDDGCRYGRQLEDFEFVQVWQFTTSVDESVTLTHCTLVGRGREIELPLEMFTFDDLQMVTREIEYDVREDSAKRAFDAKFENCLGRLAALRAVR